MERRSIRTIVLYDDGTYADAITPELSREVLLAQHADEARYTIEDFIPVQVKQITVPDVRMYGYTGAFCPDCGGTHMVRSGTCEKCMDCGATTGCS